MASGGLLSLKWNNHKTTFFHVLSTIRSEEAYCDATIACDGRFYPVHKLVMSTCSDYFKEMFERTNCKHPVIVLKDIRHEDLEALLNYMYVGEVNVLQNELAGLIKSAECLSIKGLAVPDEAPTKESPERKRGIIREGSPQAKRRCDDSDSAPYNSSSSSSSSSSNKVRQFSQSPSSTKTLSSSSQQKQSDRGSSGSSSQSSSFKRPTSSPHQTFNSLPDNPSSSQNSNQDDSIKTNHERYKSQDKSCSQKENTVSELLVVKDEPEEIKEMEEVQEVQEDSKNVLNSSFSYDLVNEGNSMSDVGDGASLDAQGFDTQMMSGTPQSMGDLVAQVMPGSPGLQGNSLWDEGSLQGFPSEAFGDSYRSSQMVSASEGLSGGGINATGSITTGIMKPMPYHGKNYTCPYCPYHTHKISHIQTHMRTHTGEKPFSCPYCPYGASQLGNLQRHIKKRHANDMIN